MGNNISNFTDMATISSYVNILGDVYFEKSIGTARFMKTLRGRHKDGYVIIKLFIKPESGMNLSKQVKKIKEESQALLDVPNAFYFQRVMEDDRATYLVRQYLYSSLYDRISTRPFLTMIEKKWVAYQLLRAVADSHARHVYHGDIKTENVLVTSWNWVYLVDYAFYKPSYLPENNPANYSFYFDTSFRRTGYIAPERFYGPGSDIEQRMKKVAENEHKSELTPEMDIFSVGCVIAELFLEGTPLFNLSQLLKYRSGDYSPDAALDQIEDEHIRDMIKHMIQIDPAQRLSAESYLVEWHGKAFPHYFYSFLYQYMSTLNEKAPQQQAQQQQKQAESTIMSALSSAYPSINNRKITDADEKIERVFYDFEKILYFISAPCDHNKTRSDLPNTTTASSILLAPTSTIPPHHTADESYKERQTEKGQEEDEGSLILLSFICSLIRNSLYPSTKLKALDILLVLGERLPDDVKLDRLVPYLIVLLTDESALVRANGIKTLTQVLCLVESISPINARIFPEYIIPSIRPFSTDPNVLVRSTYASCIALLAETGLKFLEMAQLLKSDNVYPPNASSSLSPQDLDAEGLDYESAYDASLQDLQAVIQEQATILLIDSESAVKRALLTNITCLCVFFGRQKANDVLLSHMITYLNDKDWMLRSAFFESIKGVGTFVGAKSLEEYILPLMIQALTDAEEFVVEKVLNSLTSLADLGLFQKMKLWELVGIIWPLICHPNIWIRYGAVGFISSTAKSLPKTDLWCIIYPMLRPFLRSDIADVNETTLLENMESPISRQVYEQAIVWATKATRQSVFWKQQISKPVKDIMSSKSPRLSMTTSSYKQASLFHSFISTNEEHDNSKEDEIFLERLRSFGMSIEDEEKLRYLRDYIFKVSKAKMSRPKAVEEQSLMNLNVTPMTVFLPDLSQKARRLLSKDTTIPPIGRSHTSPRFQIPSSMRTKSREDLCKLNRVASQPHIQALLPNMADKENHNHYQDQASAIPISQNKVSYRQSPISSPSDNHFGSLPRSLERAKNTILTMDTAKQKNRKPGEPVELSLISSEATSQKTQDNDEVTLSSENTTSIGYAHLQKLLYKIATEAFPPYIPEFSGDPAVMKRIRKLANNLPGSNALYNWKPESNLVAHFTEHTGSINQLAISFDHLLFASCSDDGSVKIWDCSRLERNVTNRSRATYNQQGGRIKCITFIQQTYSIAAASDNGSIHIFRVDIYHEGSALKFGKCLPVREYQLMDEHALLIQHITSNASNTMAGSKSILLFATTKGTIYALDLLTMQVIWKLQNNKSHGVITSMLTDPNNTWLLVGTMRGILTLYDLRFQIPLKSWLHPSKSRISALALVPPWLKAEAHEKHHLVRIAAGKNEISVWDLENLQCLHVFAVKSGDEKTTGVLLEAYKALEAPPDKDILTNAFTNNEANLVENSIRAVISPCQGSFMITGGTDRKIRFWDTSRIENSSVVLGLDLDEARPRYSTNTFENMTFYFEFTHTNRNQQHGYSQLSNSTNAVAQQQYLMRNHTDAITDILLTETPYPMIISGDRDGVIKVIS
ncbi:putative serine/threonine-protein kinase VPS15 [Choanephora cucurbitarum]|uniref:non-specific serine/threonine protein kinase n=1 Tax=Choanephora cucurbitarum TaxID=101091 RepID=A0A1C7NJK2_9FUNG|nr:putative serine/threonine-protein kinase VPS15 [Choanephora cucurbitarum]